MGGSIHSDCETNKRKQTNNFVVHLKIYVLLLFSPGFYKYFSQSDCTKMLQDLNLNFLAKKERFWKLENLSGALEELNHKDLI